MTHQIPETQRAWVNFRKGPPDVALTLKSDWPVAKDLKLGEVLVQVQAGALNPVGYKLFKILPNYFAGRPRVAEFDLAGIVVDSNSPKFGIGDPVYGIITAGSASPEGALCQYAKVPADNLARRPDNVTPIQASGLTLVGQTAYEVIIARANVQPGQRVLINGGSTAVGAMAIQLAKLRGASVTAIASGKNETFVRSLGADEFVDYIEVNLPEFLSRQSESGPKYDCILEAVGTIDPALFTSCEAYLNPTGTFYSVGPQPTGFNLSGMVEVLRIVKAICLPGFLGGVKRPYSFVSLSNHPERLEIFRSFVEQGSVKPLVDSVFDFEDTLKAYDRIMSGRATGKVVVKVDPSID